MSNVHRIVLAVGGSATTVRVVEYVCKPSFAIPIDVHLRSAPLSILPGNARQFASPEAIDAYCRDEGEAALAEATAALQAHGVKFECHIVAGRAAPVIIEQADRLACTQIVMGTRGQGTVANILLGSVASNVVQLANVPVTLVGRA